MRILIVCHHWSVASGRYMTDAFKRLGHDVRHVGPAHGRLIWGMDVAEKYVWEPDGELSPRVKNTIFLYDKEDQINWTPDLILYMDSDPAILDNEAKHFYVTNEHFDTISVRDLPDIPHIVYGVDNHVRDYRRPWFDHYFLAHHAHNVSMMAWGDPQYTNLLPYAPGVYNDVVGRPYEDMTHLPCAYDPTLFTPSPISYAEREFDVAMIGVMYPQRWQLVNELHAAGLKVLAGTGLIYEDYRDAYHNARISLCVSIAGDVAQRVFETAAMGCAVVSDRCADFERLNEQGIWFFRPERAVDEIKMLLNDELAAKQLIERSLEWVRPHTWDARAQVIVDWVQKRQAGEAFYATVE